MAINAQFEEHAYKLLQALCDQLSSPDDRWRHVLHEVNGQVYAEAFGVIDAILGFAPEADASMQFAISNYGGNQMTPGCVHREESLPFSTVSDFRTWVNRINSCGDCLEHDRKNAEAGC